MTAAKLRHFGPLLLLGLAATARLGAAPDPVDTLQRASADWIKTRTETVRLAGGAGKTGQVLSIYIEGRPGARQRSTSCQSSSAAEVMVLRRR